MDGAGRTAEMAMRSSASPLVGFDVFWDYNGRAEFIDQENCEMREFSCTRELFLPYFGIAGMVRIPGGSIRMSMLSRQGAGDHLP
jgi:hypothetical protein